MRYFSNRYIKLIRTIRAYSSFFFSLFLSIFFFNCQVPHKKVAEPVLQQKFFILFLTIPRSSSTIQTYNNLKPAINFAICIQPWLIAVVYKVRLSRLSTVGIYFNTDLGSRSLSIFVYVGVQDFLILSYELSICYCSFTDYRNDSKNLKVKRITVLL